MDKFTRYGMDRVDRGHRVATWLTLIGYTIGALGAVAVAVVAIAALSDDSDSRDATLYAIWAVIVGFQTIVVVTVFLALASIVDLLAGHYELSLIEAIDEDDEGEEESVR